VLKHAEFAFADSKPRAARRACFVCVRAPYKRSSNSSTARKQDNMAAATATHAAAPARLLDLPDALLERILVAASGGGDWDSLGNARAACSRLRAVAEAAARKLKWSERCLCGLGALLPRLGGLERVQLDFGLECDSCASYWGAEALEFISTKAQEVAQGFCE
jgi:hypothetical protein